MKKIFSESELKSSTHQIVEKIKKVGFAIVWLDEETKGKELLKQLDKERKIRLGVRPDKAEWLKREYCFVAFIAAGEAGKPFRETYHRDSLLVRPQALSKSQLMELGLPGHGEFGMPIHAKLMVGIKPRQK
ncbi:MAG: hypothetical protein WCG98_04200 [bacterium]